jgi:hypothetical protein
METVRYSWEPWRFGFVEAPPPCSDAGNSVGEDASGDADSAAGGGLPSFVSERFHAVILRSAARWTFTNNQCDSAQEDTAGWSSARLATVRSGIWLPRVVDEPRPAPGSWTGLGGMAEGTREFLSAWEDYRAKVEEYRELDDERVLVLVRASGRGTCG